MLTIDGKEKKLLTFNIEIDGINSNDLIGFIRFNHKNIEYGFPVEITSDLITSNIPPLYEMFPDLKNKTIINMRLDINSEDRIFSPWNEDVEILMPVTIEAKLSDKENVILEENNISKKMDIKVKAITESIKSKQNNREKSTKLEDLKKYVNEEFTYRYMEKVGTKKKEIQKIIYEQAINAAQSSDDYKIFRQVVKILGKKKPK